MTDAAILADVGGLLSELATLGIQETASDYDPAHFGNYYVDLTVPMETFGLLATEGSICSTEISSA